MRIFSQVREDEKLNDFQPKFKEESFIQKKILKVSPFLSPPPKLIDNFLRITTSHEQSLMTKPLSDNRSISKGYKDQILQSKDQQKSILLLSLQGRESRKNQEQEKQLNSVPLTSRLSQQTFLRDQQQSISPYQQVFQNIQINWVTIFYKAKLLLNSNFLPRAQSNKNLFLQQGKDYRIYAFIYSILQSEEMRGNEALPSQIKKSNKRIRNQRTCLTSGQVLSRNSLDQKIEGLKKEIKSVHDFEIGVHQSQTQRQYIIPQSPFHLPQKDDFQYEGKNNLLTIDQKNEMNRLINQNHRRYNSEKLGYKNVAMRKYTQEEEGEREEQIEKKEALTHQNEDASLAAEQPNSKSILLTQTLEKYLSQNLKKYGSNPQVKMKDKESFSKLKSQKGNRIKETPIQNYINSFSLAEAITREERNQLNPVPPINLPIVQHFLMSKIKQEKNNFSQSGSNYSDLFSPSPQNSKVNSFNNPSSHFCETPSPRQLGCKNGNLFHIKGSSSLIKSSAPSFSFQASHSHSHTIPHANIQVIEQDQMKSKNFQPTKKLLSLYNSNLLSAQQLRKQFIATQQSENKKSPCPSSSTAESRLNQVAQNKTQGSSFNQEEQTAILQTEKPQIKQSPSPFLLIKEHKIINIVNTFAVKSRPGSQINKPVKTNQDNFIVFPSFCTHKEKYLFGVCDGHGTNGHLVSEFIKKNLPVHFETQLKISGNDSNLISVKRSIHSAFQKTSQELFDSSKIDIELSGSTCVIVFINSNKIWCANLGDSRAIQAKSLDNTNFFPLSLSQDQKPQNVKEEKRIIASGGRVDPYRDMHGNAQGPPRVWVRDDNMPGLAMSRSFGDQMAKRVGVISDPEIEYLEINKDDKFIVIASDGVWEFLSNEEVVKIITPYYLKNDAEGACQQLIKRSVEMWKKEQSVVDDITAIIIFLDVEQNQDNAFGQKKYGSILE